jgi:UDP-GlcNAc:undecaprenyl-phosphate GlcNAc-1-phosphate transferase
MPVAYLIVFGAAVLAAYLLTFPVRIVTQRFGAVAQPDDRMVHDRPTSTVGGTAMYIGFLVAMLVAVHLPALREVFAGSSEALGLVLGASAIFFVGFIDDLRDMSAPAKVAGQVLAAMILYFLGVTMFWIKVPFGSYVVLSSAFLPLVTAIWVVGMANAVNLIDGLDGLAAGIVAIASGSLAIYSIHLVDLGALPRNSIGPLIAVIACGVCIGFLPHNFHPARIFMGDAGSMLLGLLMAASTMVIGGRASPYSGDTFFFFAPLFVPFFILGVPILDTAFAVVRRTANRTGVAHPDRDHLHHRLMRLGHGHRRAVLILWAWTALLSGFVLYPTFDPRGNKIIPLGIALLALLLYTGFRPLGHRRDTAVRSPSEAHDTVESTSAAQAATSSTRSTSEEISPADGAVQSENALQANGSLPERRSAPPKTAGGRSLAHQARHMRQ